MPAPDPKTTRSALVALCRLFAPGDSGVKREALLALDDPAGYVKTFAKRLRLRGLREPRPNLAFIAVSDALIARQRGFVVDHRSEPSAIVRSLEATLAALGLDAAKLLAWYDEDRWGESSAGAFLKRCGHVLAAHGHALVSLDLGSDGWEPTVIPFEAVAGAVASGKALGMGARGRVRSLSPGKRPAALPAPAKPPPPKAHDAFPLPEGKAPPNGYGHGEGSMLWTTKPPRGRVIEVQLGTWPPTLRELLRSEHPGLLLATSASGARVVSTAHVPKDEGSPQRMGEFVLHRSDGTAVDLGLRLPAGVAPERVGLFGEAVVVLPDEASYRRTDLRRPLLWEGKTFVELQELPATKVAVEEEFLRQGLARTGAGEPVLLWEGRGWVRERGRFALRYALGKMDGGAELEAAPLKGDSFLLLAGTDFLEIRRGKPPKPLLPEARNVTEITQGPGQTVILHLLRYYSRKSLLALVYDHATGECIQVPPEALGIRDEERTDILRYVPATDRLVALHRGEIRSVPWSTLTSFPRVSAKGKVNVRAEGMRGR